MMKFLTKRVFVLLLTGVVLTACAPEVGSEQWCKDMKNKSKGDWTLTESKDFAKHCIF